MRLSDIHLRDPFVLPVASEGRYYLYGTGNLPDGSRGFRVYTSTDLTEWDGPHVAFRPPSDFWATQDFWAPEVHQHDGRYYLLATFKAPGKARGTQALVANHPRGPFVPDGSGPLTPQGWECLDGTLWWENGQPWMVFCHEWMQLGDGTMDAVRLTPDLSAPVGDPILLWAASQAPWVVSLADYPGAAHLHGQPKLVTDGPFLFRTRTGTLAMLWSSFSTQGYALALARSSSGSVVGPWTLDPDLLFHADGGHGMLFQAFDGQLYLTLHQPNKGPRERPQFFPVTLTERGIALALPPSPGIEPVQ